MMTIICSAAVPVGRWALFTMGRKHGSSIVFSGVAHQTQNGHLLSGDPQQSQRIKELITRILEAAHQPRAPAFYRNSVERVVGTEQDAIATFVKNSVLVLRSMPEKIGNKGPDWLIFEQDATADSIVSNIHAMLTNQQQSSAHWGCAASLVATIAILYFGLGFGFLACFAATLAATHGLSKLTDKIFEWHNASSTQKFLESIGSELDTNGAATPAGI